MSRKRGPVSITIARHGDLEPRVIVLSARRVRLLGILVPVAGVVLLGMLASWVSLALRASEADELEREVSVLRVRTDSMEMFVELLATLEARQEQIRRLFGLTAPGDSGLWLPGPGGAGRRAGGPIAGDTATAPTMWPLTEAGFVTQPLLEGAEGDHPGIDIAVPSSSYIRAAGGGEVIEAALDSDYGLFVIIDHGDNYRSRYGHASYLAVQRGQKVRQGEVIALSGSTGRSTAPHLHFEILRYGRPIDPMSMLSPP